MSGHRLGVRRLALIILLLIAGFLVAHKLGDGSLPDAHDEVSATLLTPPELRVQLGRNRLLLSVTTASPEHEAALQALVDHQFGDYSVHTRYHAGLLLPPEWESITTAILNLVATTKSATAVVDASGINIRGVTEKRSDYESRLLLVRAELADNFDIAADVITVQPAARMRDLCARNFAAIANQARTARTIEFHESSAELGDAAEPFLDRLAEFAYDCRDHKIAILGYTDASGPAEWNLQVSTARAQAVAAQLIQRGVAKDRLLVEGRGAESPLANNDTAQGRAQNRRIEFELR